MKPQTHPPDPWNRALIRRKKINLEPHDIEKSPGSLVPSVSFDNSNQTFLPPTANSPFLPANKSPSRPLILLEAVRPPGQSSSQMDSGGLTYLYRRQRTAHPLSRPDRNIMPSGRGVWWILFLFKLPGCFVSLSQATFLGTMSEIHKKLVWSNN